MTSPRLDDSLQTTPAHVATLRLGPVGLCLVILLTAISTASAQSGSEDAPGDYHQIIKQALSAFKAQHLEEARDLFERAHALQPSARTLRGLGVTAFAQNRFTLAKPELEAALIDGRKPLTQEQRDEVTGCLSWLRTHTGTLQLQLTPDYALALVDSAAVNAGTNVIELGEHLLEVRANGYDTHRERFTLANDRTLSLSVVLSPSTPIDVSAARATVEPPPEAEPAIASNQVDRTTESGTVFETWWFWTAAAVVVAGTLTTVLLATHKPALHSGYPVTTPTWN